MNNINMNPAKSIQKKPNEFLIKRSPPLNVKKPNVSKLESDLIECNRFRTTFERCYPSKARIN
jgi:hypothetical protein